MHEHVAKAFAENGPLHLRKGGGEWREVQSHLASHVAKSLTDEPVSAANADTGIGKSLAVLIPAVMDYRLNGKRTIIATPTHSLIDQLIPEMELANSIVDEILGKGVAATVANRPSRMNVPCPDIAKSIGRFKGADDHAKAYADFVSNNPDGLLSEWLELEISESRFPEINGVRFDSRTLSTKKKLCDRIEEQIDAASKASVCVITHAMLMYGARCDGKGLGFNCDSPNGFSNLIVDEADQLAMALESNSDAVSTVYDIESIVFRLQGKGKNVKLARQNWATIADHLRRYATNTMRDLRDEAAKKGEWDALSDLLTTFYSELEKATEESDAFKSQMLGSELRRNGAGLSQLAFVLKRAGTSDTKNEDLTCSKPFVLNDSYRNTISFGIHATNGHGAALTVFRNSNLSFKNTFLMSATLTSGKGADDVMKRLRLSGAPVKSFSPSSFGNIGEVITPAVDNYPSVFDETGGISERFITATVSGMMDLMVGRTLVLVTSHEMARRLTEGLISAGVREDEIVVGKKANTKELEKFKNSGRFWIGTRWFGDNMVLGGETLINNIVIPRWPFMVRDGLKSQNSSIVSKDAARRVAQGIGRGIRSYNDTINIMVCDHRVDGRRIKIEDALPERFRRLKNAKRMKFDGSKTTIFTTRKPKI